MIPEIMKLPITATVNEPLVAVTIKQYSPGDKHWESSLRITLSVSDCEDIKR